MAGSYEGARAPRRTALWALGGRFVAVLFYVTNVSQQTTTANEAMDPLHIAVTDRPAGTALTGTKQSPDSAVGRPRSISAARFRPSRRNIDTGERAADKGAMADMARRIGPEGMHRAPRHGLRCAWDEEGG